MHMIWDSVVRAVNGPLQVKLALALVIIGAFLYLRRKETEGAMGGYALLGVLLALRDIVFAFVPSVDFFRASDLLLFGGLLFLGARPFGGGPALWIPLAADLLAFALLGLKAGLGILADLPSEPLRLVALGPILATALIPALRREEADTPARELGARTWLPLSLGSLSYLVLGALLGSGSPFFQSLAAPLFYALLLSLSLFFIDIAQGQLVSAVDYYEESVDSLYDLLLAAGAALKPEFSMQDVLDNVLRAVVDRTGANGGIILLADEFEDSVSVRSLHGSYPPPWKLPDGLSRTRELVAEMARHARFKLGEGLLGEVARSGKHFFAPSPDDPRLPDNGDEDWLRRGSMIAAPLIVRDRIIGAISVARTGGASFSERDFDRCKLLANFGSIAVANSFSFLEAAERSDIDREAAIAEEVQRTLSPKMLPELPGLSFGAFTSPARGVCSDYYDIIQTRPDRAVLVVGDVAGKGVAASLVMVMIRSILHLIINSAKDAATLLQWINRGVTGKVDLDHYATLGLIAADASTGSLDFANAGHQPLLLYRADSQSIETVEIKSVPIGVERAYAYPAKRVVLRPGDVLVMYTDGIVEAMNSQGKQYGRKNLGNAVERCHDLPAREIAARIRADLLEFSGPSHQHDDQTALVMKAKEREGGI
jgi:sigma-B regulation protein RsbU (phosphoserine phosphatase)